MTSVFGADGKNIPCTVIEAGPCVVTQLKTPEKDGYSAVQIAYDETTEKHTSNSLLGHFKKANTTPKRKLVEFTSFENELNLGDVITVERLGGRYGHLQRQGLPGRCETSRVRRCRRTNARPAQPSAQAGVAGCLFVSVARVQRQTPSGPYRRRARYGAQPAYR